MIHIKRFIDRVGQLDGKGKDLVLPLVEARGLRDELTKMLVDNNQLMATQLSKVPTESKLQVEIVGGKF
jgi:hypothetical protein